MVCVGDIEDIEKKKISWKISSDLFEIQTISFSLSIIDYCIVHKMFCTNYLIKFQHKGRCQNWSISFDKKSVSPLT